MTINFQKKNRKEKKISENHKKNWNWINNNVCMFKLSFYILKMALSSLVNNLNGSHFRIRWYNNMTHTLNFLFRLFKTIRKYNPRLSHQFFSIDFKKSSRLSVRLFVFVCLLRAITPSIIWIDFDDFVCLVGLTSEVVS